MSAVVDLARHLDFGGAQAPRGILPGMTLRGRRIEPAAARILNQAVLEPIGGIASREGGGVQDGQPACNQDGLAIGTGIRDGVPAMEEGVLDAEVQGRCARSNAVEISGVALGLHQRFAAPIGTATEVGIARRPTVVLGDQRLGDECGDVDAAVAEVHSGLRIMDGPAAIHTAFVTHVRGGQDQLAAGGRHAAAGVIVQIHMEHAAQTAAAELQVALRPARYRQVHFKAYAGLDYARDAAVRTALALAHLSGIAEVNRAIGHPGQIGLLQVRAGHDGCHGSQRLQSGRIGGAAGQQTAAKEWSQEGRPDEGRHHEGAQSSFHRSLSSSLGSGAIVAAIGCTVAVADGGLDVLQGQDGTSAPSSIRSRAWYAKRAVPPPRRARCYLATP